MSFLESVLFENLFQFICILDCPHFCCVISFSSFSFSVFSCKSLSFVGLAKLMGQGGRDFTFQSSFSFQAVSHFFRAETFFNSILLRVVMFQSSRLEGLLISVVSYTPIFRSRVVSIFD